MWPKERAESRARCTHCSASSGWLRRACKRPCRLMINGSSRSFFEASAIRCSARSQISSHERKLCVIPESICAVSAFSPIQISALLLRAREFPAIEVDKLQVVASSLWIRPARLLTSDPRFLKPSDMQANRSHPVVGPFIVRLDRQNLFQSRQASGCGNSWPDSTG